MKPVVQVAKRFAKKEGGGQVSYVPVKTGAPAEAGGENTFTRKDLLFLFTKHRHISIAFTRFCPLHATNHHAPGACDAWLKVARAQTKERDARVAAFQTRQESKEDKNERAHSSREAERRAL